MYSFFGELVCFKLGCRTQTNPTKQANRMQSTTSPTESNAKKCKTDKPNLTYRNATNLP